MSYIGNTSSVQQYAPQVAYFSGDASTVAFTLPVSVVSAAQIIVAVANVIQNPSSAYTVSGTTLTFTSAPPSGTNNIWVQYTTIQTNIVTPAAASVGLTQLSATGTPSSSNYLRGDNSWAALTSSQWTTSSSDIYYTAGKVGIGTSSPISQLHSKGAGSGTFGPYNDPLVVEGSDYTYLHLKSANNQAAILFNRGGSTGWFSGLDNSGNMKFAYMSAISGTGVTNAKDGTAALLIDTSGRVTMPYNPAYVASYGTSADITITSGSTLAMDSAYLNRGGHYSTSTYRFTAPVAGVYQFGATIMVSNATTDTGSRFTWTINGSQFIIGNDIPELRMKDPLQSRTVSATILLSLNVNDYVSFRQRSSVDSAIIYTGHSWIYGYLIG